MSYFAIALKPTVEINISYQQNENNKLYLKKRKKKNDSTFIKLHNVYICLTYLLRVLQENATSLWSGF